MAGKYRVGDFVSELFLSKVDETLLFVLEDADGNMTELEFDDSRYTGTGRMFVFKEKEKSKLWNELRNIDDGK